MIKQNEKIKTKESFSKILLLIFDSISILISLFIASFITLDAITLNTAIGLIPLFIIVSIVLVYDGIYIQRFDFWEETVIILKSLALCIFMTFTYVSVTNSLENYPASLVLLSFLIMAVLIPIVKKILKTKLFRLGFWKKEVKILDEDTHLVDEIFDNPYLGYVKSTSNDTKDVFINSFNKNPDDLRQQLSEQIQSKRNVLFIPVFNNYQFNNSNVFQLTSTRTNLIVLQNKLTSKTRMLVNIVYNYILALILLPLLLPIIGIIAIAIKLDSKGPVFFKQKRLGKDGKLFMVYKFRTMYTQDIQKELLEKYLKENPEEIRNYEIYCKYNNDPRITKVGQKLRSTSLDEVAQIFNVLKGEMNFIGPRPYLETEKEKMGYKNQNVILKAKPGITGLWQVSGRNELTFNERMDLDKWYIQNWSLRKDFVIFMQTINVVLNKVGAK